ncbi:MAG: acriflavine resistance protein B [Bacteroidetes bacterium 43-93]|uniref:efflux RND transporter permease subunit n=1 Tax=uncultured Dysgonomonas sp. TaxID=206096 RepID=UPI00092B14D9|nr:efflux RND transporter permease subunit [uncultured Dysgonomonas sp.]MBN9485245.1 efflux RND transporter permease subunit [Bacteroidota bacterium]OJW95760.1 MAG: acriflavine resistance protein B [Bacteroidetes bacterium 43-93]
MKNFFVNYKSPIGVLLAFILLAGTLAYTKFQTSLFPEITFPKIKIIADAGLQPVDKMMVTVTKPIENAIKQVPDLQTLRSTTSRGSCEISAFMNWNSDINITQQRIESRINEIKGSLPPETQVTVERMNPSILPVMGYTLESKSLSAIEMKMLATYTIKPFLSQVAGVAEIRIIGGRQKEYWITLNQQKMSALGITPDMLTFTLNQTGFVKSNGYLSDYRYLYLSITDATVRNLEEIKNLVVRNDGKRAVLLSDIGIVGVHDATEYTRINANGKDAVLVAVIKQPNSNLLTVSDDIRSKVAQLKQLLPQGVSIKPYYDQSDFVKASVNSVTDSLWVGLVLAIVVAIIFLRSAKASLTILLTIPVTICLTLIILYLVGYSLNIMTLGALAAAIGLIIDDAIVVMEQIHRTHEENPEEPSRDLVQKAIKYLLPAMIGSSVSTIVIFFPFVMMTGVAGAYFNVLTNTMLITLVCSFFVTWIGLPVIYLLINRNASKFKGEHSHSIKSQKWVSFLITRPAISVIIVIVFIASIILILPQLQTGFLPEMDEGSIVLDYNSPPGTSLEETDRMLREVEKIIVKIPEVEAYSRRTGTQMGFFITEPNRGDYLIQLKKHRKRSTEDVIADIRKQIESTQPALRVDFGQVIGDMLGDLMTSVQPIEIKIFGDDQQKLKELSTQVADISSKVNGVADVFDGVVIAGPSISVLPEYARLAQYGITPANFQSQIQIALQGTISGNVLEKEQLTNIRLIYPNSRQLDINSMKKLPIFLPNGQLKPADELAAINITTGESEIQRENLQSMGVVTARLDNRDLGSAVQEIKRGVDRSVQLPQGYHIVYGGSYAQQQQSFHELLLILIASALLVFSVILFLFRNIAVAALIVLVAILGISGSYVALFLTNTPLNVGSYTGLIMIIGIIGENAIFTFLQFRDALSSNSVKDAVIFSISARLRPKLMTALGAIIALMPLALGIGTGAQLHQPLAIAVIGGFLSALILLLVVLPTFLMLLFKNHKKADTDTTN